MRAVIILCVITLFTSICSAAKIVMMPHFGKSHYLVMAKLGDELKARGHQVVIVVGDEAEFAIGKPNVKIFEVLSGEGKIGRENFKGTSSTEEGSLWYQISLLFEYQKNYCDSFLSNKNTLNELNDADVVIGDGLYLCSRLVADKYGIPHVIVTMSPLSTAVFRSFGISSYPAFVPQLMSELTPNMGFLDRLKNLGFYLVAEVAMEYLLYPTYNEVKIKHNITPQKTIKQTLANVDLVLMQREFIMDVAQPIPPHVREVGNFLPGPAQPLPAELEDFVKGSGDNGIILVAFGSVIRTLSDEVIQMMNEAFSKVNQRVLWKVNVDKFKGKISPNIKTLEWLPQNDILGHNKTKLFITHGGANGLVEAVYHGVPMICSPFFGDQHDNARFLKHNGFGEVLSVGDATADQLVSLINQVINEKRYRTRTNHVSRVLKMRPRSPVKEAADLIEYVHAVGNLDHLKPRSLELPFYQLYMIDVLLVLGLVIILTAYVIVALFKRVFKLIFSSSTKMKTS